MKKSSAKNFYQFAWDFENFLAFKLSTYFRGAGYIYLLNNKSSAGVAYGYGGGGNGHGEFVGLLEGGLLF